MRGLRLHSQLGGYVQSQRAYATGLNDGGNFGSHILGLPICVCFKIT